MESSTTQKGGGPSVSFEFGAWPIEGNVLGNVNDTRVAFNSLLIKITPFFAKGNERYLSIVKTKLEEACMFAIKGVAKPGTVGNSN